MANIVKDDSNNPIPQYQSESGNFEPLKGSNGAAFMQLTGSNAINHETLSVGTSAVGFASVPAGAKKAIVTTETADIRYWVDGSNPTTSQGHLVKAGGGVELDSLGQLSNFKSISVSGIATLQISYF